MSIEKILFPTKFRELAFNSLESLLVLRKAGLRQVILCHIISREEVGFVPYGGYLKEEEERLREEARIRFEDWQRTLSDKGIESKIVIVVGKPAPQILHIAKEEGVDLIVFGRKKRIDTQSFVGSHTLQIISRTQIPTLVSKYMVRFELDGVPIMKINDRIFEMPLIAVNWSDVSQRAVRFLAEFGEVINKVFIFHNIAIKISAAHKKEEIRQMEEESTKRLEGFCEILRNSGIETELHLSAGGMLDEILRISRERKASMIVIGNTCRGRLHEMLHKSISYQVTKRSELPTLLVP
jgi:nucleotide-binding universal stress UspA family protein